MNARTLETALREERLRRPEMRAEDAVKYVFQALLGVGHLLAGREAVADYIASEMNALAPDPKEPLLEPVGDEWCRLNLRRAMAEGLTPGMIAGLMLAVAPAKAHTRQEVLDVCQQLARDGDPLFADASALARITDETWLPSHSPAYRAAYRPAYRLISADWQPAMAAVLRIARKTETDRLLVTLDGPCATGKTTLAARLAAVFEAQTLHTDDFVIPHAQKTPERLAIPGGNCDAGRLTEEALIPWKGGAAVHFRRYDWTARALCPPETLPPCRVLILEGSYCNLPVIRALADVRLFLTAPWAVREARLRRRESPASFQRFLDLWIPLEDAYFDAYALPDGGCTVIEEA